MPDGNNQAVREYWNVNLHDLTITREPIGTPAFFEALDNYRFNKLRYLPLYVDFGGYEGQDILEVGCGVGIDLARFARGGAHVTGIDLSEVAIDLARQNFAQRDLPGEFLVMDGGETTFSDNHFDMVYAHGVVQYTANPKAMIDEIYRVLRPGGQAIIMVYNRHSWLMAMSRVTGVGLEHEDAPYLKTYSLREFRALLRPFENVKIMPERFPVPTELHDGLKSVLYNHIFVSGFNLLPRKWVARYGWHLLALAQKPD